MTLLRTGNELAQHPKWSRAERWVRQKMQFLNSPLYEMYLSLSALCRLSEVDIRGIFRWDTLDSGDFVLLDSPTPGQHSQLRCNLFMISLDGPGSYPRGKPMICALCIMSSACPMGRTPCQPGEYVGEYKGMNWLLCPWAGENSRHCFEFEGKGWGNSKFCKITDANTEISGGFAAFPNPYQRA